MTCTAPKTSIAVCTVPDKSDAHICTVEVDFLVPSFFRAAKYFLIMINSELARAINDGIAHLHSRIDGLGRQLGEINLG
jgi:hypothetical protein